MCIYVDMNPCGTCNALTDNYGRTVKSLRMSITNRCNFNCIYCHNEGDHGSQSEMSAETIANIVGAASRMGVNKLKISGGEPLIRTDLEDITKIKGCFFNNKCINAKR